MGRVARVLSGTGGATAAASRQRSCRLREFTSLERLRRAGFRADDVPSQRN